MIFLDKNIDHIIGNDRLDELASVRDVSSEEISCSLVCGNQIGGLIVGSRPGFVRYVEYMLTMWLARRLSVDSFCLSKIR